MTDHSEVAVDTEFGARPRRSIPESTRRSVWARDKGKCVYCGFPGKAVDHVVPRIEGGKDSAENLVVACVKCNSTASGRVFTSFREKREWIIERRRPQIVAVEPHKPHPGDVALLRYHPRYRIELGTRVTTANTVRPKKFASKTGVVVCRSEGELGVDFNADGKPDAWFLHEELVPKDIPQRRHTGRRATQTSEVGGTGRETAVAS